MTHWSYLSSLRKSLYFLWCISAIIVFSDQYMDCSKMQCQNTFINCLPREHCHVLCDSNHSCSGSVINCPLFGDCLIQCHGDESCKDIIVDASLSSGHFNIICNGTTSTDNCQNMKIYGSTLPHNIHSFDVSCGRNVRSCSDSEIHCPVNINGECSINCHGNQSCAYSNIIGPNNGGLDVHCKSEQSCFHSIINGATSSYLNITGCSEYKSCFDLAIYCPPNVDGVKRCFIEGNDNLGRERHTLPPSQSPTSYPTAPTMNPTIFTFNPTSMPTSEPTISPQTGMMIYAVNGWQDVDITYTGQYGPHHGGYMKCGSSYDTSCDIASNSWSCSDESICSPPSTTTFWTTTTKTTAAIQGDIIIVSSVEKISTTTTTATSSTYSWSTWLNTTRSYSNDSVSIGRQGGELLILGGTAILLFMCVCVGWAQASKDRAAFQEKDEIGHKKTDHGKKQKKKQRKRRNLKQMRQQRERSMSMMKITVVGDKERLALKRYPQNPRDREDSLG